MAAEHDRLEPGSAAAEAEAAIARVAAWAAAIRPDVDAGAAPRDESGRATADLLEGTRRDGDRLAFTRHLLEAVAGAGDPFTAALGLRAASQELPASLPVRDRLAVRAGGLASLGLPWAVLPVARRWLRERVSHLVLSARLPDGRERGASALRAALRRDAAAGFETVLALGGESVLGPDGVERERDRLIRLVSEPGVARVAVDPVRITPPSPAGTGYWALDADAERGAGILSAVLLAAQEHECGVVLEPSDYRGALLAPVLLSRALASPELIAVRSGAHLPAELPESREAAEQLILLSRQRVAAGAAPLELTVGEIGMAGQAQVDALLSGLAVPVLEGREAVQAQLLRLVELVLAAGPAVRAAVATEDPGLLAAATLIADRHDAPLGVQLQAGVAPELAGTLAEHGLAVRMRLPFIAPKELGGAIGWLIRLAAEAGDPASAPARAAELPFAARSRPDAQAELARVIGLGREPFPPSHRTQLRGREWDPGERDGALYYRPPAEPGPFDTGGLTAAVLGLARDETGQIVIEPGLPEQRVPVVSRSGFACEPDTDASRPQNREWARRALTRATLLRATWSTETDDEPALHERRGDAADREALLQAAAPVVEAWRAQPAAERGTRIGRLALGTASARDRLLAVLAAETGLPVAALDAEVSGAIDAARYLGRLAEGTGSLRGAEFRPDRLALVVADAGASLSERAEAVLAVLAAGSAAVLVCDASIARSSSALVEEWEAAGLPAGMVALGIAPPVAAAHAPDPVDAHARFAASLAADPRVERALVIGRRETARGLIRHRPDLRVEARLRTLGSTLVAPSADPADAVAAVVRSAFAGASGLRTARAVVLLGSAARSKRLRRLLVDAVQGLRIGDSAASPGHGSADPLAFDIGPLPAPPDAAGLRALTELAPGEEWLVEPRRLDDAGRLWSPGVRLGIRRDATFWDDAAGVPVIGVISAATLGEAIELQNVLGGGGVAALHGFDEAETLPWLDGVRAASLSIGRATTDARVEHQPGGGWDAAAMGAQPLCGGPNRLVTLGSWQLREGTPSSTLHLRGLDIEVQALIETAQASLDYPDFDRVRRAALSDALAWRTSLGRVHDEIGLGVERNVLRHWPVATHVRLAEGGVAAELLRVIAAGLLVGAQMSVSTGQLLAPEVSRFLEEQGIAVSLERDDAWLERIALAGAAAGEPSAVERVRLIGGDPVRAAEWLGGRDRVPLWAEPVTMAGPVELLVFLREQAISVAANRYGLVSPIVGVDARLAELDARVSPVL